ncbi:hypothetical protein COO60DRAFT_1150147 [Scenedesmus sp. NREL 46B-D3]|nr:hypothetical protein COO60DRAFT_1150147 [Scenedesmus sp. NREL 46B-D3]
MHQQQMQTSPQQQQACSPEQLMPLHTADGHDSLNYPAAATSASVAAVTPKARQRVAPLQPAALQGRSQQQQQLQHRAPSPTQVVRQAAATAAATSPAGRLKLPGVTPGRSHAATGSAAGAAGSQRALSAQRAATGSSSRISSRAGSPARAPQRAAANIRGKSPPQVAARLHWRPAALAAAGQRGTGLSAAAALAAATAARGAPATAAAATAAEETAPWRGLQALQQHRWQQRCQVCDTTPVWPLCL